MIFLGQWVVLMVIYSCYKGQFDLLYLSDFPGLSVLSRDVRDRDQKFKLYRGPDQEKKATGTDPEATRKRMM
jgi:hypothetical protein